ncbi:TIR domain-containing protein [Mesorhizobium sp. M1406]|uniref:TIR domain-containing protein n=1 Tax=Mesorhizobium sp. M1406 TaxID=2957099 RepID=UPI00333B3404
MGYRNKTYVIFDGDNDMWAYAYMKGWKQSEHIDFDFYDAHDINGIRDGSSEDTVKRRLRERLKNTKQAIVLIGTSTKNLFRYVRWEIDTCLEMGIPVLGVNLNGSRVIDEYSPPILRKKDAMFVSFKAKIITYAMDDYFDNFRSSYHGHSDDWHYPDKIYTGLGL